MEIGLLLLGSWWRWEERLEYLVNATICFNTRVNATLLNILNTLFILSSQFALFNHNNGKSHQYTKKKDCHQYENDNNSAFDHLSSSYEWDAEDNQNQSYRYY